MYERRSRVEREKVHLVEAELRLASDADNEDEANIKGEREPLSSHRVCVYADTSARSLFLMEILFNW